MCHLFFLVLQFVEHRLLVRFHACDLCMYEVEKLRGILLETLFDGNEGVHNVFRVGHEHGTGGADRKPEVGAIGDHGDFVGFACLCLEARESFEEAMGNA